MTPIIVTGCSDCPFVGKDSRDYPVCEHMNTTKLHAYLSALSWFELALPHGDDAGHLDLRTWEAL